jgi:hypothetical protein
VFVGIQTQNLAMSWSLSVVGSPLLAIVAAGCSSAVVNTPAESARLQFKMYDERVGVIYDYNKLEPKVNEVVLKRSPSATFTEQDVGSFAIAPQFAATMSLTLTKDATARIGTALSNADETYPVVATIDGKPFWVGVVYNPIGAAAIRTPIVSISRNADGLAVVKIDAWIGVFGTSLSSKEPTRIDSDELRAILATRSAR